MMIRAWLLLLFGAVALLGVTPVVEAYGGNSSVSSGSPISSVTLSATPRAGDVFALVAAGVRTSLSLQGTWSSGCTSTITSNGSEFVYYRAVTSSDATSNTVPVLSSSTFEESLVLYDIGSSGGYDTSNCSQNASTGSQSLSATTATSGELAIDDINLYCDYGTKCQESGFSQCSPFSTDGTTNAYATINTAFAGFGNESNVSGTVSCTAVINVTTSGSLNTWAAFGALVLFKPGSSGWQPFGIWKDHLRTRVRRDGR